MTGRPGLQSSKSIAQTPSTKRMPLLPGRGQRSAVHSHRHLAASLDPAMDALRRRRLAVRQYAILRGDRKLRQRLPLPAPFVLASLK